MADFPSTFACVTKNAYSEKFESKLFYLGNKSVLADKMYVEVSVTVDGENEQRNFYDWYATGVSKYGELPFTINIPIAGVHRDWKVLMIGAPTLTLGENGEARTIKLKLKVLDDVASHV
jgi:hypothetical protein